MDRNTATTLVKILAIVFIVFGALAVLGGIMMLAGGTMFGVWMPFHMSGMLLAFFGALMAAVGAFELWTGVEMLKFKPWTKTAGLVLGIISILNIPLGTIVGIFAIWLLAVDPTVKSMFEGQPPATAPPQPPHLR